MDKFRRILMLMLVLILVAVPVYAKDDNVDQLKFEDIEKLMNRHNPSIQVNKNLIKNLEDGIDAMEDAEDDKEDLEDAIDGIDDGISMLNELIDDQTSMLEALNLSLFPGGEGFLPGEDDDTDTGLIGQDPDEENGEEDEGSGDIQLPINNQPDGLVYGTLGKTIMYVQVLYEMNLQSLESNIDMLEDQLDALEKLPSQIMELEKTINS